MRTATTMRSSHFEKLRELWRTIRRTNVVVVAVSLCMSICRYVLKRVLQSEAPNPDHSRYVLKQALQSEAPSPDRSITTQQNTVNLLAAYAWF